MELRTYNKLVRDKIPEVMEEQNLKFKIKVIEEEEEYVRALQIKLLEEIEEYFISLEISELADIYEVVKTIHEVKDEPMLPSITDHVSYIEVPSKNLFRKVEQYIISQHKDELDDIMEAFYLILEVRNIDKNTIEELRQEKYNQRGGFKKRLFLIEGQIS